ncbi:unnamed protein product [Sphenostylis stenocarpa]|uniref:TF-B3 domain-containing protein n=1 Tax=Sphenostylis stenocarpa TaxID=92480 RepID=A0AA86VUB4_9FABA|nr:unnamed protein product [Sphenostylis stenocarpa]
MDNSKHGSELQIVANHRLAAGVYGRNEMSDEGCQISRAIVLDNTMATTAKKYFFKVFFPEKHTEKIVIPSSFVKSTRLGRRRIPEDVILRNVSGRVWCVKTRLIGHKIYFQEGWKVFQEENCIGKEDFLLFKHDGTNVFKVVILEQSSRCERNEVEENEVIDITEEEEREQTEDEDECFDDENSYDNCTQMEEESEKEHMRSQSNRSRASNTTSSTPKGPHLEDYEFDPQMYIQPENPYFEAKLYKNRPNELHVPANVFKDLSLTFPQEITLSRCLCFQSEDIQSNELRQNHFGLSQQTPMYSEVTKVSEWQDGRVCLKGWANFCTKNKIKENDACICEIVSGEDRIVRKFWVHVLGATNG